METKRLAELIGVHPDSVRRWTRRYAQFMSNSATPKAGESRVYTQHDVSVMAYIATQRETGLDLDQIFERLKELQSNEWQDLESAPDDWFEPFTDDSISLVDASKRAKDLAQVAVLQNELQNAREQLQESRERVQQLEHAMQQLQASERTTQGELNSMRVDLEAERGKVAALEARLSAYAITGSGQPVPVAAIIVAALVAGALLVALALVLARLVLV